MAGQLRIEEYSGVVIRATEHRNQYAADRVFKGKTAEQFATSLNGKLVPIKNWIEMDQKASEIAGKKDTSIGALKTAITEYNSSIAGEFGTNSEAYRTRPSAATRAEGWEAVVIRAIEHRNEYAADKVFKDQTTEQWTTFLQTNLLPITNWVKAKQQADHVEEARDTAIEELKTEIREYNASIAGEFGKKSEAYRTRPRLTHAGSGGGKPAGTRVNPS
jgi:hypothetical protein